MTGGGRRQAGHARLLCLSFVGVVLAAAPAAFGAYTSAAAAGPEALASAMLAAPTGLAAANGACIQNKSIQVNLSWTATDSNFADGYRILRSTTSGGPYSLIASVSGLGTTTYTDTGAAFSSTYYYVVQAKKNAWTSTNSGEASLTTPNNHCR